MDIFPPTRFNWDGIAMVPLHPRRADKQFVVGQGYTLVQHEERSSKSHAHEFAWLHEAYQNLPEHLAERFHSAESLRKYALIKAGYSNSQSLACSSKAEAERVAAFIRPMDEFSIVTIQGTTVTKFTARSQSRRAMDKREFQDSKTRVMEIIASMIGVAPEQLAQARAA